MKREIRFRAIYDGRMHDNKEALRLLYNKATDGPYITNAIIMQFTGLKAKKGADVYEGDIVKCTSGCPHVVEWREEIGGAYIGGMPGWYLSDLLTGNGNGYAWMGTEEVIGNVYENPELKPSH
jgi:hypothetical protein